jgi:hypothetical protein
MLPLITHPNYSVNNSCNKGIGARLPAITQIKGPNMSDFRNDCLELKVMLWELQININSIESHRAFNRMLAGENHEIQSSTQPKLMSFPPPGALTTPKTPSEDQSTNYTHNTPPHQNKKKKKDQSQPLVYENLQTLYVIILSCLPLNVI